MELFGSNFNLFRKREAPTPGVPSSTMPPEPPKVEGGDYLERIVATRSPEAACSVSAVYRAVTLRGDTMGVMPVQYRKKDFEGGNFVQDMRGLGKRINYLLQEEPNPIMTAADMWNLVELNRTLTGNGFVYIERDEFGFPLHLWLVKSCGYNINTATYASIVYLTDHGYVTEVNVPTSDVLHFPNNFRYPNGWGKSTLAVFLKVMFYGFDGEMKRNEEGNERLRYRPWGGGIYGGSVTFQKGDKAYRMLRIFGARKKEDTFHLYDEETGLPSSDFSEQIGEELFGIDRESFSRTVFWSQQDHETEATTMIQAKIGDIEAEQGDLPDYDRAIRQVRREIERLSPDRSSGQIRKKEARAAVLEAEAARLAVRNLHVVRADVFDLLKRANRRFDIVFADPPYALEGLPTLPDMVFDKDILTDDGIFVLEHPREFSFEEHPHFWQHRAYGKVNFTFFAKQLDE